MGDGRWTSGWDARPEPIRTSTSRSSEGDQHKLYDTLHHWELYYATTDHRLLPLRPAQWLEPPLHGVWVRRAPDAPWLCEFLLNEHEGAE